MLYKNDIKMNDDCKEYYLELNSMEVALFNCFIVCYYNGSDIIDISEADINNMVYILAMALHTNTLLLDYKKVSNALCVYYGIY